MCPKKSSILFFITLLFYSFSSFSNIDFEKQFNIGRDKYLEAKYSEAMIILMPITKDSKQNKYVEKAQFFYALAAFKDKKFSESYQMLLQLTNKYPQWVDINEANYLAAAAAFELKKYRYALNFLKISDDKMKDDIFNLKGYYLQKLQALDSLINIHKSYPQDVAIAQVLFDRLGKQKLLDEKQKMLFQYLQQEFKFSNSTKANNQIVLKPKYNIALVLPLLLGNSEYELFHRENSYVLDLYRGLSMALDTINMKDSKISLQVFDSGKDQTKIDALIKSNDLEDFDLIVGPLLPLHNAAIGKYSMEHNVPIVNPISNNSKLMISNPMQFLFLPTLENQVSSLLNHVKETWVNKEKTKVAIYYGDSAKDSILAKVYRDSLLNAKLQVPIYEKIKKDKLFRITQALSDSNKTKGFSHIFVSSIDEITAATFISALEKSMKPIPLVTRAEWLNIPTLNLEQMQKRNIHFLYPEFNVSNNLNLDNFKRNYTVKFNVLPSAYSAIGYELMMFYGSVLKEFGSNFNSRFPKNGFREGILMGGYKFGSTFSNHYAPLVKFEEMNLKVVNPLR
jgi:ABC-type branched-subunit amino acid transport system substrate-binding protein